MICKNCNGHGYVKKKAVDTLGNELNYYIDAPCPAHNIQTMKQRIILTKGLPASGKTTWAKELLRKEPGKWKRINKDDLRAMLDGGKWSKDNEKYVLEVRDLLIHSALAQGYNVIVDDTNLTQKHWDHIKDMFTKMNIIGLEVEMELKDFTDVPLEECIKRDQTRSNYVGEKVIRKMYNQSLRQKPIKIERDPNLPEAIICDLDGTLALFDDNPYDRDFSKDKVNSAVYAAIHAYQEQARGSVLLVSGRNSKFLEQTKDWLREEGIRYDELWMPRAETDNRKDVIIKQEIYEADIKGKYNILFVLDDRNQVVDFWRSQGLTVFQVAEGDF